MQWYSLTKNSKAKLQFKNYFGTKSASVKCWWIWQSDLLCLLLFLCFNRVIVLHLIWCRRRPFLSLSLSHTHTHSHTLYLPLSHSLKHTHTLTRTFSLLHRYIHTPKYRLLLFICLSLSLSQPNFVFSYFVCLFYISLLK